MDSGLRAEGLDFDALLEREWLTVNGVGGYASSTLPGLNTRKYHGLLIAAMAPPVRRMVLLSRMEESLWCRGQRFALDCNEYPGVIYPQGQRHLRKFFPGKSPRWIYEGDGWRVQKQLTLVQGSNTVLLTYTLLDGEIDLQLRPLMALRPIHDLSYQFNGRIATEDRGPHHHRVAPTSRTPEVFFAHDGEFVAGSNWYLNQIYRREQQRGYSGLEDLWTPGTVRFHLTAGAAARFGCSTDPIDSDILHRPPDESRSVASDDVLHHLYAAAEQFVVVAHGDRPASCIVGYPWTAPKSREALIGFTGLFLVPGRFDEARSLLLSLASQIRNGLMPSEFPEDGSDPVYHGADISLWFANAVWDFLRYSPDEDPALVSRLLDAILSVIGDYRAGTDLGLSAGNDGLLESRANGIPTSWMDAKVADWVVTPRAGAPVELNALWYNAVRVAGVICAQTGRQDRARSLDQLGDLISKSFNDRFWNEAEGCCFDVVDGQTTDASFRPNQLLAASLPFPVLSVDRHEALLKKVTDCLLVRVGVRTLCPSHENYRARYAGHALERDGALHNGPAFPWLLGPYVQLLLRVRGANSASRVAAHDVIERCIEYAMNQGMGQIPELFDGESPHSPGGALASGASIGEIVRIYSEAVLGICPVPAISDRLRPAAKARIAKESVKSARPTRDLSLPSAQD